MTSTPSQQPATTASNNTAAPAATSYASAAGAVKKPSSTPVVATGSNHAKVPSVSPVNGRPIMPAVPTGAPSAPAVVHGTSTANGQADHNRKTSVTISANGPNNYVANGASTGAKSSIQFGYQSPAASHSIPQPTSASIPIPAGGRGVTEPRNSPSPIPLPSASGGRPPSGAAPASTSLNFGSFDNERSATLGPQQAAHIRRESDVSNHGGHQPAGMNRGSFQGSRGGRGFNPQFASSGYPPNNTYRGQGNQTRGGMHNFGGNGRHFPPSTQQNRSPALSQAAPVMPPAPMQQMPGYYYQAPVPGANQGFYPSMPMPVMGYPTYQNMVPQGSPGTQFQPPVYMPQGYPMPPTTQAMSRNNSQISEQRPASSTGQPPAPISHGTPQQQAAQLKPAGGPNSTYVRPAKRSSAITITNENGEAIDLRKLKPAAPASPATTSQPSRTPPIVSSTPTPPPKTSTPKPFISAHGRADSTSNSKTAEEKRNEFMEKVKQTATGDKPKDEEATKTTPEKPVADDKAKSEPTAEDVSKPAEAVKEKDVEVKETAEHPTEVTTAGKQAPSDPAQMSEEELERILAEMEAEDARRVEEEEELNKKRQAEKAAKAKAEEEARLANAAENDRKLREQEREMERLEEEKDRKRAAAAAAAQGEASEGPGELSKKTDSVAKNDSNEDAKLPSAAAIKPSASGRAAKPQALTLAPLNTKTVEAPQPSAALQSLKTARLLDVIKTDIYPPGISSPNPALNAAVAKKGTSFKYDSAFLLQFKTVFTEKPSLDFDQQVKSLIGEGDGRSASTRSAGGSGRQNTRNNTSSFPMQGMGTFNNASAPPLQPGTTSAERFAMSNIKGTSSSRGPMSLGSFSRSGTGFTGGNTMSRTPSSNMGSLQHSPRQGSSRRTGSKPNTHKTESQIAKTMPLTANMNIEGLSISQTGWKPRSIGKGPAASNPPPNALMDPEMVQRKVKSALNKMTPDNFERISDQILDIAAQSKEETDGRTLRQVIQLTFEKATDEAHWASMYAKFCKKMLETMSPEVRDDSIKDKNGNVVNGGALFRKYLLNRCQEEFERGWKIKLPEQGDEGDGKKTEEAALLSDEYYKAAAAKRRGLGLVQFIGELFKLGMLTERIMHQCVLKLVDYQGIPEEAEVESLCKLLRTIGDNLDAAEKGKAMMNAYFERIQATIVLPGLPSRLQFMLMDIVDLRKKNWVSKENNKGPKTLEEVRAEAEAAAAQKAAESARNNQRGGGGRSQLGRGDARHMQGGYPQPPPNQVGMDDLRRLKGGASRTASSNITLGPMSTLNSRSNSNRRLAPGSSLGRGADDSGASSRTGTPPVKEAPTSTNSFGLLANMDADHPGSPPSAAASPALAKATPETSAAPEKEGN